MCVQRKEVHVCNHSLVFRVEGQSLAHNSVPAQWVVYKLHMHAAYLCVQCVILTAHVYVCMSCNTCTQKLQLSSNILAWLAAIVLVAKWLQCWCQHVYRARYNTQGNERDGTPSKGVRGHASYGNIAPEYRNSWSLVYKSYSGLVSCG